MDAAEVIKGLETARNEIDRQIEVLRELVAPQQAANPDAPLPRLICFGRKLSKDEKEGVLWIEDNGGPKADFLMPCMAFETGMTFRPDIKNAAGSSGTGLIQFMASTAINLGTTVQELAQMSRLKQLGYVYKYFRQFGKDLSGWTLEDVYMAILYPKAIGKPLDYVFDWGELANKQNAGLDKDKSGTITKREAAAGVQRMYEIGMGPEMRG